MLRTLARSAAAFALALLPFGAHAQEAPAPAAEAAAIQDADPALWVVKDEDTTIYLFGTVHVLKPGLGWFDEAVRDAFDASDDVVLEIITPDMAEMQGRVMKLAVSSDSETLREKLPEDKRAPYEAALADLGVPAVAMDRFEPWFVAMTLSVAPLQKLGYDPTKGAEYVITEAAEAAGKPILALETVDEQLGFFDSLPDDVQVQYLVSIVDDYANIGPTLDRMVVQWASGNPDQLGAIMNDEMRETPEVAEALLGARNQRWATWIDARMEKPGTVFIAVGAGHLAGDDSVQHYLAKEHGLTAERVEY